MCARIKIIHAMINCVSTLSQVLHLTDGFISRQQRQRLGTTVKGEECTRASSPFLLRARRVVGIVLKASPRSNGRPVCAVACHVPALSACQRSASTNPCRSSNLDWSLRRRTILQPRSLRLRRVSAAAGARRVVVLPGCYPT